MKSLSLLLLLLLPFFWKIESSYVFNEVQVKWSEVKWGLEVINSEVKWSEDYEEEKIMKLFIYILMFLVSLIQFIFRYGSWQIEIKKIIDTNYLIIINDTYTLKNKSYEKGQCVKMINYYMVHTSTQDEVDNILTTTKINRIIIMKFKLKYFQKNKLKKWFKK